VGEMSSKFSECGKFLDKFVLIVQEMTYIREKNFLKKIY
jgi:hypothetical protein